jgi:Sec-independent protein translocase protein TatA
MEFFNIGPLELIIFLILAFLVLGPKGMILTAYNIGKWIRSAIRSPMWREILRYSQEIRELPKKLMDETGLEAELKAVQDTTDEAIKEVNSSLKEVAEASRVPEAEHIRLETGPASVPASTKPGGSPQVVPQASSEPASVAEDSAVLADSAADNVEPAEQVVPAGQVVPVEQEVPAEQEVLTAGEVEGQPVTGEPTQEAARAETPEQAEPLIDPRAAARRAAVRKRIERGEPSIDTPAAEEPQTSDLPSDLTAEAADVPAPRKRASRKKAVV